MKWGISLIIPVIVVIMTLYEWPKMTPEMAKEKKAFAVFTILGTVLAYVLLFNPNMPGPTTLIDFLYKPLVNILDSLMTER